MQRAPAFVLTVCGILLAAIAVAQSPDLFHARLDWVPIGGAERNDVAGSGSVTASLSRNRLSINGTYAGLPAAATLASLHQGVATGARGPVIAGLELTHGIDGTISGEVTLNREQRDALLGGHLYIQIHAEHGVAPDNAVLWGWLLPNTRSAQ